MKKTFQQGDWVSFDIGGVMMWHTVIGLVHRVHADSLEVVFNGQSLILLHEDVKERRRGK